MKTRCILPVLVCLGTVWNAARGVALGDARESVLAELGMPETNALIAPGVEKLTYPSGEIRLRDGTVCYILLASDSTPASVDDRADATVQLRIAELEARIAAMQVRLARAEAEARAGRRSATSASWHPATAQIRTGTSVTRDRASPFPRTAAHPVSEVAVTGLARSGDGL